MWIPRSQPMRRPILQFLAGFPPEREVYVDEIVEHLRQHFRLTEEAASHLSDPTASSRDRTSRFRRNCGGALSGLKQDGSIERTCDAHYRITEKGRNFLGNGAPTAPSPPDGDYRSHKSLLYRNQDGKCVLCNGQFDYEEMEIDHIMPRSRGGSDAVDNLQLLCRQCNRRKSARSQSEAVGIVRR